MIDDPLHSAMDRFISRTLWIWHCLCRISSSSQDQSSSLDLRLPHCKSSVRSFILLLCLLFPLFSPPSHFNFFFYFLFFTNDYLSSNLSIHFCVALLILDFRLLHRTLWTHSLQNRLRKVNPTMSVFPPYWNTTTPASSLPVFVPHNSHRSGGSLHGPTFHDPKRIHNIYTMDLELIPYQCHLFPIVSLLVQDFDIWLLWWCTCAPSSRLERIRSFPPHNPLAPVPLYRYAFARPFLLVL